MIAMSDNIPPSQMLRVPSALVDAVKELSRLHRSGYTSAVLTGLQQLIAAIDSSVDSVSSVAAGKSDTELLAELIAGLDERIAAQVAVQVAQLEERMSAQLEEHMRERQEDSMQWYTKACDLGRELERAKQQSPYPDELAIGEDARLGQLSGGIAEKTTPALEPVEVLDEVSAIPNIPVSQEASSSISEKGETASFLAKRFKKSVSTITRAAGNLSEEEFKEWSRNLDSDKIAWEQVPGTGTSKQNPKRYRKISAASS